MPRNSSNIILDNLGQHAVPGDLLCTSLALSFGQQLNVLLITFIVLIAFMMFDIYSKYGMPRLTECWKKNCESKLISVEADFFFQMEINTKTANTFKSISIFQSHAANLQFCTCRFLLSLKLSWMPWHHDWFCLWKSKSEVKCAMQLPGDFMKPPMCIVPVQLTPCVGLLMT